MRDNHYQTRAEHRAHIAKMAKESFARHVLRGLGSTSDVQIFWCREPGSRNFSFRVLLYPGTVIVAGDIGDSIFHHADADSIGWLRKAEVDYLLRKVADPHRIFMAGDALAYVERIATNDGEYTPEKRAKLEAIADEDERTRELLHFDSGLKRCSEQAEKVREEWIHEEDSADFYEALSHADVDDPPDCRDFASGHIWAAEALRWFIAAYDAELGKPIDVVDWETAKAEAWRRWPASVPGAPSGTAWIDGMGVHHVGIYLGDGKRESRGRGVSYAAAVADCDAAPQRAEVQP